MKGGVNLINLEARKNLQLAKLKAQIKQAVLAIVGIFIVLSFLFFLAFLTVQATFKNNERKINILKEQIKVLEKNESYTVTIADRVKGVNTILKERKSYLGLLTDLEKLLVPGFQLQNLQFASTGELKISGQCLDTASLTDFNDQVEAIRQKSRYKRIVFPAVTRSLTGDYLISLELKQ